MSVNDILVDEQSVPFTLLTLHCQCTVLQFLKGIKKKTSPGNLEQGKCSHSKLALTLAYFSFKTDAYKETVPSENFLNM